MIDRKNTIDNLEQNIRWIEEIECHQFPGWGNVTMAMRDAVELLKEQESEAQIASEQGFHEGYSQAMSEMPKETRHITNEERLDMRNIQEIRDGNGNVRYIRNGSYVIMRRDIYDKYMEKVGEHGCG